MNSLHGFLVAHGSLALAIVGLVAFAESLLVVGTFVPAAVVMFAAGSMIGAGSLNLWATLAVAVVGAVAGDALSFELGRRRGDRIRHWALFRRHASAVAAGNLFLARHGGKSVVLARFMGPVRAFIPVLAGFAGMPPARFYAFNVGSALLWAPAHILPGVLFGSSLALAEAVSGRLALLLLLLAGLAWLVARSVAWMVRAAPPMLRRCRALLAAIALRHRGTRWAAILSLAVGPQRQDFMPLFLGGVVLLVAAGAFLTLMTEVVLGEWIIQFDASVLGLLQQLRSAPVDRWMIAVTEMGSVGVILPLVLVVLAWLLAARCWRTAVLWAMTVAFAEISVQLLKFTLGRSRPLSMYSGLERFSFPSGHATMTAVVLGLLACLVSRGAPAWAKAAVGTLAAAYVGLVAFSRLYLGAHWMSDVLGGVALAATWVSLAALVHGLHQRREHFAPRKLLVAAVGTLAMAGAIWIPQRAQSDRQRYSSLVAPATALGAGQWLEGAWARLPQRRSEMSGEAEEAFPLQLACKEAEVGAALAKAGWSQPPPWSAQAALSLLLPAPAAALRPVLPRLNGGLSPRFTFVSTKAGEPRILRLWRSGFVLQDGKGDATVLWYGAVYERSDTASVAAVLGEALPARTLLPDLFESPSLTGQPAAAPGPLLLRCGSA